MEWTSGASGVRECLDKLTALQDDLQKSDAKVQHIRI